MALTVLVLNGSLFRNLTRLTLVSYRSAISSGSLRLVLPSPRNSSLPLGLAIYILRKMPRKPDESSVECYGHGFLIAARPRGV